MNFYWFVLCDGLWKTGSKGWKDSDSNARFKLFCVLTVFWKMQGLRLEGNKRISAWSASSSWQENEAFLVTSQAKVCPLEVLDRKVEMQSKVNGWVKLSVFLVLLWQEKMLKSAVGQCQSWHGSMVFLTAFLQQCQSEAFAAWSSAVLCSQ